MSTTSLLLGDFMQQIGMRLKKIRNLLNLSQQEVADKIGISKQAISNIENSKSMPSMNYLCKLLVDYNVNLNYVIGGIGSYFITNQEDYSKLKVNLMKEVEEYLEKRGIV